MYARRHPKIPNRRHRQTSWHCTGSRPYAPWRSASRHCVGQVSAGTDLAVLLFAGNTNDHVHLLLYCKIALVILRYERILICVSQGNNTTSTTVCQEKSQTLLKTGREILCFQQGLCIRCLRLAVPGPWLHQHLGNRQTMDSSRFLPIRSSSSIRACFSGVARKVGMDMLRANAGFPAL